MQIFIPGGWTLFCIFFAIVLLTAFIMQQQGKQFYTHDVVLRSFSMMDLELAATAQEIVNLVKGIYSLPPQNAQKVIRALRGQLYVDFLFMPAAYGAIFILCIQLSWKVHDIGVMFFSVLAWLQCIPWVCDIIENIYLLRKIQPYPVRSEQFTFKMYQYLEALKWGIALLGTVCAFSCLLYFWLSGQYASASLRYVIIIVVEIIVFVVAGRFYKKQAALPF